MGPFDLQKHDERINRSLRDAAASGEVGNGFSGNIFRASRDTRVPNAPYSRNEVSRSELVGNPSLSPTNPRTIRLPHTITLPRTIMLHRREMR